MVLPEVRLVADCASCFALCCSLPFSRGREFPEDKPGDVSCRHLRDDDRCGIHADLRSRGWVGCAEFDCFGAGQQVSQVTYHGARERVRTVEGMAVFGVVRGLHEMRFLLADPAVRGSPYADEAAALDIELADAAGSSPDDLLAVDLTVLRGRAGDLFARVGAAAGAVSERGSLLLAADLTGRNLAGVDLLGADLRDADLSGADLTGALFLTQAQVNASRGDADTRLPARLSRPEHWVATG